MCEVGRKLTGQVLRNGIIGNWDFGQSNPANTIRRAVSLPHLKTAPPGAARHAIRGRVTLWHDPVVPLLPSGFPHAQNLGALLWFTFRHRLPQQSNVLIVTRFAFGHVVVNGHLRVLVAQHF